ncbi:MAG: F0F1 ATP synthase subunit delta [Anaerolineae bacterium]
MALIPDLWTVVFQVLNFLAIVVLLYWLLFKPLMRRIRERSEEKRALMEQLRRDREEAAALRAKWEKRCAAAEEEAAEILSAAQEQAKEERQMLLEEAQGEVERVLVEAHAEAARLRRQAVEEFHDELVKAILEIAATIIHQVAPEPLHRSMVEDLTDRIWEMGRSEMSRVEAFRRSLGDRAPTAYVVSAQPLTPELRGNLARTLTALADRNVDLDITVDPRLAVGLRVRLGDIVVENSIAGQLEELEGMVSSALREQLEA